MPVDAPREYILELYRQNTLVESFALPNVSSYERRPIPALSREWTAAKRPVKQSAGYREEEIRISGVSGIRPTGLFTADPSKRLATGEIDGVAYFEALLAFLKRYEDEAAQYRSVWVQNAALAPNMVFRDLSGGGAWYVDDMQIVPLSRVGGSRNSYEYTLTMKTEGEAVANVYQYLANTPTQAIPYSERLTASTFTQATRLNDPAVAPVVAAGEAATQSWVQSLTQTLRDLPAELRFYDPPVRRWLAQAENFASIYTAALAAGLGVPRDAARNFKAYCDQTARIVYGLYDAVSLPLRDVARGFLDDINSGLDAVSLSLTTLLGMAGSKLGPTDHPVTLAGGNTSAGAQAVTVQRVLAGEDLAAFAARVLGAASRWVELASLNQLPSPWTLPDGSPIVAGTTLLVPYAPLGADRAPDGYPFDLYGTDLIWDFDAMDFVTEGTASTDFLDVSGAPNLKQGLLTRFSTSLGAVLVRPALGLPNTLGQIITPARNALKASQIVTQAGADPRIKRVARVTFQTNGNAQFANLTLVPVTDEGFTLAVPVAVQ